MKIAAKLFSILFISAVVLVTGCSKKPARPTPDQTMFGPGGANAGANANLTPTDVTTTADANSALTQREGVIEDEFTIRGLLQPVYFDYDRSALKASERAKLDEAIKYLAEHPEHRILLEGHCDWRGTAEYNLGLGDRRAGAAKQYLTGKAVDAKKLETLSKGSLDATKGGTEEVMGKDRKVEVVILKK
jgi:peptidoglycan-associated lipoprotein